jgi:peroxiredoxin
VPVQDKNAEPKLPDVIPQPNGPPSSNPPATDGLGAPVPIGQTPVGSCVLVGQKLVDFSLLNLHGEAWQYKRDHKGQLVLLDFWTTSNDVTHIHQLTNLQKTYGSFGLEVVGIAYEGGDFDQQVKNVRSIRGRYGINYPTILGGPADSCQIRKQFDVNKYPTLILIDERGQFLYRTEGLEKPQSQELEAEIRKRLGIAETYPRAGE